MFFIGQFDKLCAGDTDKMLLNSISMYLGRGFLAERFQVPFMELIQLKTYLPINKGILKLIEQ